MHVISGPSGSRAPALLAVGVGTQPRVTCRCSLHTKDSQIWNCQPYLGGNWKYWDESCAKKTGGTGLVRVAFLEDKRMGLSPGLEGKTKKELKLAGHFPFSQPYERDGEERRHGRKNGRRLGRMGEGDRSRKGVNHATTA